MQNYHPSSWRLGGQITIYVFRQWDLAVLKFLLQITLLLVTFKVFHQVIELAN